MLARLPLLDAPRIVFVDGALRADLSVMPAAGFARFAEQPDFGTLTWPDREPMVALNTMLADRRRGAACARRASTAAWCSLSASPAAMRDFHPRHSIRLAEGARLTLVEISAGQGAIC